MNRVSLAADLQAHPLLTMLGLIIVLAGLGWIIYRVAGGTWPNLK